jgi:hypothetical protein
MLEVQNWKWMNATFDRSNMNASITAVPYARRPSP